MTLAPHATRPSPAPGPAPVRPRLRRVSYDPEPGTAPAGPLPAAPARRASQRPSEPADDPAEFASAYQDISRILRVALEVLDRRRSWVQLADHFAPAPLRCWQVAAMRRRPRSPAELRRMRMCMPRSGVAEVALVADMDGRVRAVAARFEHAVLTHPAGSASSADCHPPAVAGWRCTDIRLG